MNNNIADIYPLSPTQQGMLFHSLYEPASGTYITQIGCELHGQLNISAFAQAWQQVINQYPVLRTAFVWEKLEQPLQVVGQQVKLPWEELDWCGIPSIEQQEKLENLLYSDRLRGFQLAKAPLMRLMLIHLTDTSYYFVWSHHHLLLDGWSIPIIFQQVISYYQEDRPTPKSSRPYRDYIAWLQQQDLSSSQAFWQEKLKGLTAPTPLGINQVTRQIPNPETIHVEQQIQLSTATTTALKSLAQQQHLTLNTLVQGAWALLLRRYSGQDDVVFGTTVSGRPPTLVNVESMVGLFINTLPMRVKVDDSQFLIPWLEQLQAEHLEARQYEYSPLVEIHGWTEVPRDLPLFASIVVFENYPLDSTQIPGLEIINVRSWEKTNYPLTVSAFPGAELVLKISCDRQHFDTTTISRIIGHLQTLLTAIATNPHQQLSQLPILTPSEQHQLLVEWNQTQVDYPQNTCIHHLFEQQVERTPEAIALVFGEAQLTYHQLNQKANQLAHHLQQLGVKPETLVGICLERSIEMVVGLLAILKAGGAYIPIDPSYPPQRIAFMLKDAQPPILLTQAIIAPTLPTHNAQVICLDSDWDKIATHSPENPHSGVTLDHLIYVIYTSGSTGQPKGAMNTHQALSNRLLWMQDTYQLTPEDRVLQKTPFSFDVSVWEFFWPLITGAKLVIAQPGGHQDSGYLVKLIAKEQVTTVHFVPSMLQVFLEEPELATCSCLQRVICSGEALPKALADRFFTHLDAQLHNLYGPTEAAIDVTYWQCQPQSQLAIVPIGRPIANTQLYILDESGQPTPVGVVGELHIGGVGLARGYLHRPDLTAQKFISHPLIDGGCLYKTGDLARYLPDGEIEYIGRIDYQVKIRGFRIELEEIAAVLNQHPQVRETVVMARTDDSGNQYLVAYIIPDLKTHIVTNELREFLQEKLPEYMLPKTFVCLAALPLTPNGKVDRQALPVPDNSRHDEVVFVSPRTPTEEILAAIYADVLGLEEVSIYDNFFALGGHSLLATKVISRLREAFKIELPLRSLFERPTIADLATRLETMRLALTQVSHAVGVVEKGRKEIEL
ncbi:non-ribosomal peptide synthetase [Nostoc sp. TCL26-01]|uniref:non-ribosomal peptide synthetase n=1 Tax=Nostoc sp. TCL26-01 TaxID=2576904 RepID=UPI0015B8E7D8|nr:non-ribosomal peptide synthetase [Nostoc sp. TCL26-01]QLE54756.1 amino acid adenylation domain-containing protein [Nostoc sp. TCL26-01]